MLAFLALAVALIVWAVVSSTSGGGKNNGADDQDGRKPAETITPSAGPSDPPAVTDRPGGTGGDDGSGDDKDSDKDSDEGSDGGSGAEDGGGSGGEDGGKGGGNGDSAGSQGSGAGAGSAGGGAGGGNRPAGASVPDCAPSAVKVSVRSLDNSYEPGETPRFELVVTNSGAKDCKVDFGADASVLTVVETSSDKRLWSSGDCPSSRSSDLILVPGDGRSSRAFSWDRRRSAPDCATPSGGATKAAAGTYWVEAKVPGLPQARGSFRLESS